MRCLYCGKELALLKRLTGGGEFCSDAHKQSYQEEYNRLALSRLLQAQSKTEESKSRPGKEAAKTKSQPRQAPAAQSEELVAIAMANFFAQKPGLREFSASSQTVITSFAEVLKQQPSMPLGPSLDIGPTEVEQEPPVAERVPFTFTPASPEEVPEGQKSAGESTTTVAEVALQFRERKAKRAHARMIRVPVAPVLAHLDSPPWLEFLNNEAALDFDFPSAEGLDISPSDRPRPNLAPNPPIGKPEAGRMPDQRSIPIVRSYAIDQVMDPTLPQAASVVSGLAASEAAAVCLAEYEPQISSEAQRAPKLVSMTVSIVSPAREKTASEVYGLKAAPEDVPAQPSSGLKRAMEQASRWMKGDR